MDGNGAGEIAGCPRRTLVRAAAGLVVGSLVGGCQQAGATGHGLGGRASDQPTNGAGGARAEGWVVLARTANVPLGGGVVVSDVLLVQPTAGSFRAFSVVCPHRGARVSAPVAGVMTCWEHNSTFKIDDGSRLGGRQPEG
jgi:nitrite reductase/ring-hydroxylating ferredoxin subunit